MRISDWSSDVCSSDLKITRSERSRTMCGTYNPLFFRGGGWGWCRTERVGGGALSIRYAVPGKSGILASDQNFGRFAKIGRASCGERGCQYVEISVVAVS